MTSLMRRDRTPIEASPFARMDRILDEWFRAMPMRRAFPRDWDETAEELIRVDQFRDGDTMVVRAEIPGIDPAQDATITVQDGMLTIKAERKIEKEQQDKGYLRREIRCGTMTRTLPLPEGADEGDIAATYKNGVLEVRVPMPAEQTPAEPTPIPITTD